MPQNPPVNPVNPVSFKNGFTKKILLTWIYLGLNASLWCTNNKARTQNQKKYIKATKKF